MTASNSSAPSGVESFVFSAPSTLSWEDAGYEWPMVSFLTRILARTLEILSSYLRFIAARRSGRLRSASSRMAARCVDAPYSGLMKERACPLTLTILPGMATTSSTDLAPSGAYATLTETSGITLTKSEEPSMDLRAVSTCSTAPSACPLSGPKTFMQTSQVARKGYSLRWSEQASPPPMSLLQIE